MYANVLYLNNIKKYFVFYSYNRYNMISMIDLFDSKIDYKTHLVVELKSEFTREEPTKNKQTNKQTEIKVHQAKLELIFIEFEKYIYMLDLNLINAYDSQN